MGKACQHIQGDAEQFNPQEDHDEIAGISQKHGSDDREDHQHIVLTAVDIHALEKVKGNCRARQAREKEDDIQKDSKTIHFNHAAKAGLRSVCLTQRQHHCCDHSESSEDCCPDFSIPGNP
jgi:hypothetical protein